MDKRYLLLEDGTYFEGKPLGTDNFKVGELVFNTSMVSYQDILIDTSYCQQIVAMTYPMIGNYGINRDAFQTVFPYLFGLVVSEACEMPSNFRSEMTIDEFMKLRNVAGISDIDTRMLTRHLRENGSMKATFTSNLENLDKKIKDLKEHKISERFVEKVSITKAFHIPSDGKKILILDFGSTNQSLKELNSKNLDITIVPYNTSVKEIEALNVDAIVISNGPGNPNLLTEEVETLRELVGKYPILGIGLGHQLLALAKGAKVEKLKVGHRGSNYPIKDVKKQRTNIYTTNNSYTVNPSSLEKTGLKMSYIGPDGTCEGLENVELGIYSVQFYPEKEVYEKFIEVVENKEEKNA